MDPAVTRHAQARMQQRAIRTDAVERLVEFGREAFDHRGGVVLYFDKAARWRLARAAPGAKDLERLTRCHVVLSPGVEVVTVGHPPRHPRLIELSVHHLLRVRADRAENPRKDLPRQLRPARDPEGARAEIPHRKRAEVFAGNS